MPEDNPELSTFKQRTLQRVHDKLSYTLFKLLLALIGLAFAVLFLMLLAKLPGAF